MGIKWAIILVLTVIYGQGSINARMLNFQVPSSFIKIKVPSQIPRPNPVQSLRNPVQSIKNRGSLRNPVQTIKNPVHSIKKQYKLTNSRRRPATIEKRMRNGVQEYMEAHQSAVALGINGWRTRDEKINLRERGLTLIVKGISSDTGGDEKVLYFAERRGKLLQHGVALPLPVWLKENRKLFIKWNKSLRNVYPNLTRPLEASDAEFKILKNGPAPGDGWKLLYLLKLHEGKEIYYKIGFTINRRKRLSQLNGEYKRLTGKSVEHEEVLYLAECKFGFLAEKLAREAVSTSRSPQRWRGGTNYFNITAEMGREVIDKAVQLVRLADAQNVYPEVETVRLLPDPYGIVDEYY